MHTDPSEDQSRPVKTALVIGGTRRVGRWVSESLLVAGYNVAAVYREQEETALRFRAEMQAAGYMLDVIQTDATDAAECSDVVQSVAAAGEGLDVLAICTGAAAHGPLTATSSSEFERIWQANVLAAHNAVIAAKPFIRLKQGRIIMFLTAGAETMKAYRDIPVYGACKAMLSSYCRSLAREMAAHKSTVNCVALGVTDLPAEGVPSIDHDKLPTGEPVTQDDVCAAIWYLTGPASRQTTGTVINLGGGFGL